MNQLNSLSRLIEAARRVTMTAAEIEEQKRDFAYGNTRLENSAVTREMVDSAAENRRSE